MPRHHDGDSRQTDKATGERRVSDALGNPTNTPLDVLKLVVFALDGGWRHALLDAEWMAWVCPHVHATAEEAERCQEKEGLVPERVPEGLTLEEVQELLSIPYESDLEEGEVEVWMVGPPAPPPPRTRRRRRAGGRREGGRSRRRRRSLRPARS